MINAAGSQNFSAGFFSAGFMSAQFGNIAQMVNSPVVQNMSFNNLSQISNQFAQFCQTPSIGGQIQTQRVSGFAAIPDFANAGKLEVCKEKGVVTTPGGYEIAVKNGEVKIKNKETGKWSTIKAEPPGRTITKTKNGKETRNVEKYLYRDPAVRESDGDVWRYQGLGTFRLPDGTNIRINEAGKGKTLHIDQIDIYNGNKHVAVKSQLLSSKYKTVHTDTKKEFGKWKNVSSHRQIRNHNVYSETKQQRTTKTTYKYKQVVDQKFKTTFSDVTNDANIHDAMNADGQIFDLAGDGAAWSQAGKEVISGAGKGKDDKTKKYQLGNDIQNSTVGARQVQVPWKTIGFSYIQQVQNQFNNFTNAFQNTNSNQFLNFGQPQNYLGATAQLPGWGGLNSVYAGPYGGAGMSGNLFSQSMNAQSMTQNMFSNVNNLNTFFMGQISMGGSLSSGMMSSFRV